MKFLVIKLFFKKNDKVSFRDCRKTFFKISMIDYIVILSNLIALELVSKELNHLAAILHVYARGLNFILFFKKKMEMLSHF